MRVRPISFVFKLDNQGNHSYDSINNVQSYQKFKVNNFGFLVLRLNETSSEEKTYHLQFLDITRLKFYNFQKLMMYLYLLP